MQMQLANHHPDRELEPEQVDAALAQVIDSLRIALGDKLGKERSAADAIVSEFGAEHLARVIRNAARNIVSGLL